MSLTWTFILCFLTWECVYHTKAYEFWDDLRVTWGYKLDGTSFNRLPRNVIDAQLDGWRNTSSSCTNNGRFYGHRWMDSNDDASIVTIALLFDNNGFVAGIQALIQYEKALHSGYPYENIPMFQKTVLKGTTLYSATIYFVSPDLICQQVGLNSKLRSKNIGSASQIYIQNGPSPKFLLHAPKQRRNAVRQGWNPVGCIPGMGWHNIYHGDQWDKTNCRVLLPSCLLYTGQEELHGFCIVFPGRFASKRTESLNRRVINVLIGENKSPQCLANLAESVGLTSVHVYLTNSPWLIEQEC